MDKILDLANVGSFLAILVFVVIQVWIQRTTIKNQNIVTSRLDWLKLLKENFVEYNTVLESLIDFGRKTDIDKEQRSMEELYKKQKNQKIDLTMRFKAYDLEKEEKNKEESIYQFVAKNPGIKREADVKVKKSKIYLYSILKSADDCEGQFLKLTSAIDAYYARKRNPENLKDVSTDDAIDDSADNSKVGSIDDSKDEPDEETFLELVQQFEICICKNEWIKINQESNVFHRSVVLSKKEERSLRVLRDNLEVIIEEDIRNRENDVNEDLISTSSDEIDNGEKLAENIWDDKKTVGDNLEQVLLSIDKNPKKPLPNSMKTSTRKRYIYSIDAPVHPTGKDFVNPKKFELPKRKIKVYLEANFSRYQAKLIAAKLMRDYSSASKEH